MGVGVGVGWGSYVRLLLRATASWGWRKGVIDCVMVELRIGAGGGGVGWGSYVRLLLLRARATAPWGWGKGAIPGGSESQVTLAF